MGVVVVVVVVVVKLDSKDSNASVVSKRSSTHRHTMVVIVLTDSVLASVCPHVIHADFLRSDAAPRLCAHSVRHQTTARPGLI